MDVPQLTEDDMAEVKKEALERLRRYLCDKIIADRHFDFLRAKKVLTKEDTEEINAQNTHRKKAGKLLDLLAENPKGLDNLLLSIRVEKTQLFLIDRITDEVQKCKNEKVEALKASCYSACVPEVCKGTNNLSRMFSEDSSLYEKGKESTLLYHPEGEYSPASSASSSLYSLNVPGDGTFQKETSSCPSNVTSTTTTLPRPGDPGAPPLPAELQSEPEGACGSPSDSQFLPLRSRSS
ncbi:B-cell lymphoma/leukemia 10 [Protopterus annectens]|uniref:B-cell lymphoma/leukemia 10 n=1 Tax=Protopterus annectens TaxID=7888 RepID=UPI001CF9D9B6|nr:B-cell lymphoma/leukemia 10 [Protopterus annectens]